MTLEEKVHGLRLHVIRRAEQLGNVSRACREAGISRALFYRWRQRLERYGPDGVRPRHLQARPGRPVQLAAETERLVQADKLVGVATLCWSLTTRPYSRKAGIRSVWRRNMVRRLARLPTARPWYH